MEETLGLLLILAVLWVVSDPVGAARTIGEIVAAFRAAADGK